MPAPKGNKFAVGNKGGRPPMYKSPKALIQKIGEYFDHIQGEKVGRKWIRPQEPPTVTGLALFLGFSSRQSLLDYKEKEEFTDIIKRAVTVVENGYELKLSSMASTGAIFALKNMGWQDKISQENKNYNINSIELTEEEIKKYRKALEDDI